MEERPTTMYYVALIIKPSRLERSNSSYRSLCLLKYLTNSWNSSLLLGYIMSLTIEENCPIRSALRSIVDANDKTVELLRDAQTQQDQLTFFCGAYFCNIPLQAQHLWPALVSFWMYDTHLILVPGIVSLRGYKRWRSPD